MKKIFTLIAMAVMAVSVNAQKILVSFPTEGDVKGWTISGSTTESTVKIHQNSDAVDCLKLANGYTSDGVSNGNHIELTCEGGFKKGDVVTIAGAVSIKETDVDIKRGTAVIFVKDADGKCTALNTFTDFINGRLSSDEPVEESYTLEEDNEKLYIGRNGNTGAFITKLLVTRSLSDGVSSVKAEKTNAASYNLGGQQVKSSAKGLVIKNGKKIAQ